MQNHDAYRIALYYCYIPLSDRESVIVFHEAFSKKICGRVRVATEGLNGVLSGPHVDLTEYEELLRIYLQSLADSAVREKESFPSWELDVKYCRLRPELPVHSQLFASLEVNKTSSVVGLVDGQSERCNAKCSAKKKCSRCSRRRQRKEEKNEDTPIGPAACGREPPPRATRMSCSPTRSLAASRKWTRTTSKTWSA